MASRSVKICLVSSSGGHFEQLLKLLPLVQRYSGYIVTEDVGYMANLGGVEVRYVPAINRTDKGFIGKTIRSFRESGKILRTERPDVVISTGALPALPTLILGKLMGCKIVYIESFAKIDSPNKTGQLVYRFADRFYVQWESMLRFYPNAIYKGGIY